VESTRSSAYENTCHRVEDRPFESFAVHYNTALHSIPGNLGANIANAPRIRIRDAWFDCGLIQAQLHNLKTRDLTLFLYQWIALFAFLVSKMSLIIYLDFASILSLNFA
jgi:hypothetical protein